MNTSRHPDTASHVFSSLTVSFHICLSFLEYPAHNMGISFMLRARTLAFVPRVAVRGRSARRAREMWLAQINLRATPGTRRKLQPPACCNKLAFSSNINSGPWTHTSPEATRQHSRTRNKALEAISWHSHVTSMMGLVPQELQATVTNKRPSRKPSTCILMSALQNLISDINGSPRPDSRTALSGNGGDNSKKGGTPCGAPDVSATSVRLHICLFSPAASSPQATRQHSRTVIVHLQHGSIFAACTLHAHSNV